MTNRLPHAVRNGLPSHRLTLIGIVALAWLLRLPGLFSPSLHPDEALYGYWARLIASGRDPLLLSVWIDKPPLHLYLVAGAFNLFGPADWAARIPSLCASVLTVALVYAWAQRLAGQRVAMLAALCFACAPLPVAFGPTVFTDSLLVLLGLTACYLMLLGRPVWAGVGLALALATKQSAVFYVPLLLALAWVGRATPLPRRRLVPALSVGAVPLLLPVGAEQRAPALPLTVARMVAGFLPLFALLTWWDSLRWHNRPSFWDQSWVAYGGLAIAPPEVWLARVGGWLHLGQYLLPTLLLLPLLIVGIAALWRASHPAARVLAWFGVGFLLAHGLFTFPVWDRYLLPLAPLAALAEGWGIGALSTRLTRLAGRRWSVVVWLGVCLAATLYGGWQAASGQLPIGSSRSAYSGLHEALAWAAARTPAPAVLYHHGLSWHLDYALFDGEGGALLPRWYEDAAHLAHDSGLQPGRLWLLAPAWSSSLVEVETVLASSGRRLSLCYAADTMRLYEITPSHAAATC